MGRILLKLSGEALAGDWTAATQMLVWESQQLMRDKDFNRKESQLFYAKEFVSGSGELPTVDSSTRRYMPSGE